MLYVAKDFMMQRRKSVRKTIRPPRGLRPIPDPNNVQRQTLAPLFDVSETTILQWVNEHDCPRNANGMYSLPAVIAWRLEAVQETNKSTSDKCPHNARWRKARADMLIINLKEKQGQLVPVENVEEKWGSLLTQLKQHLLGLANSIAPRVVGLPATKISVIIDEAVREILIRTVEQYKQKEET